ncbi:3-beta-hydroxysteroid-Delta8 Delta7-isomerase-like [Crotalus adamanteus]|uniref:3-beta-hydroxysteroid-Delta8 Delta7-isomerase-like n=1 Tax=Crotalus adamanteus TaxID=8729 RepID=A0AAW1BZM7_CROAD
MSRTRFFTQLGSTQETLIGWLTCLLPYQPRVLLDLLGGFREQTRSVWCRSFASYVEWVIFYQKKPLPFPRAQLTLSQPRILLLLTWFVAGWRSKIWGPFGTWRTLIICWFTICAFVHGVIEGWFILYYMEIPGDQSILSQFWKEYSKGDSRYMISDNFIVCLETTNACFLGPFSLWTAVAFLSRQSHRYVLQLVVSVGQLYGDVLYFYTAYRDGFCHVRGGKQGPPYLKPLCILSGAANAARSSSPLCLQWVLARQTRFLLRRWQQ